LINFGNFLICGSDKEKLSAKWSFGGVKT